MIRHSTSRYSSDTFTSASGPLWLAQSQKPSVNRPNFPAQTLTAINVYALADKYDMSNLKACALQQFPSVLSSTPYSYNTSTITSQVREVIEAHYSQCASADCAMGRRVCLSIMTWMSAASKDSSFEALARKYPMLAADMYFAAREDRDKIW
jgi:hypothetical protein